MAGNEAIAMDTCAAYVRFARAHVSDADAKICFDRFHVAKLLNDAVNTVRTQENRELAAERMYVPKRTKCIWAQRPASVPFERRIEVRPAARPFTDSWPGLGDQGRGGLALGLRGEGLGDESLEEVNRMGDAQPPQSHEEGRVHGEIPPVGHRQRDRAQRQQRYRRERQLADPVGQEIGLRLLQPGALPQLHIVPPRRPRPLPRGAVSYPHEVLEPPLLSHPECEVCAGPVLGGLGQDVEHQHAFVETVASFLFIETGQQQASGKHAAQPAKTSAVAE